MDTSIASSHGNLLSVRLIYTHPQPVRGVCGTARGAGLGAFALLVVPLDDDTLHISLGGLHGVLIMLARTPCLIVAVPKSESRYYMCFLVLLFRSGPFSCSSCKA